MRARSRFLLSATILFAPALAHADLRGAPTPVTEAGCEVAVELDGPIARVTERHRLLPGGALPARGVSTNLSRCQVKVDARAGSGVRGWSGVRAAGVWIGEGAHVQGTVTGWSSDDALAIEAQPRWSGNAPVLAAAHAEAGGTI